MLLTAGLYALATFLSSGLASTPVVQGTATPYEVGERMEALDVAWTTTSDAARRSLAVPHLQRASNALSSARYSEACAALDAATFALQGREPPPEAALDVRCVPPAVAPRTTVRVVIGWAYLPDSIAPIAVGIGGRTVQVQPGRSLTLTFDSLSLGAELSRDYEAGFAIPVRVGSLQRTAYVSFVKSVERRIRDLLASSATPARDIGEALARYLANPRDIPFDLAVLDWLAAGEALSSGRRTISNLDEIPYAKHESATLRAVFPKSGETRDEPGNVVLAFHGGGATEHSFFDACGRGTAVSEALRRGWAFVSVRTTEGAAGDAIEWLLEVRKAKVKRWFVLGQGIGAEVAAKAAGSRIQPAAMAVVAPLPTAQASEWPEMPLFVSVPKPDAAQVAAWMSSLAGERTGRPDVELLQLDACASPVAMADSVRHVYAFFDRFAGAR